MKRKEVMTSASTDDTLLRKTVTAALMSRWTQIRGRPSPIAPKRPRKIPVPVATLLATTCIHCLWRAIQQDDWARIDSFLSWAPVREWLLNGYSPDHLYHMENNCPQSDYPYFLLG